MNTTQACPIGEEEPFRCGQNPLARYLWFLRALGGGMRRLLRRFASRTAAAPPRQER